MAYYNNKMNMKFQSQLVSYVANKIAKKNEDLLKSLNVDPESLLR